MYSLLIDSFAGAHCLERQTTTGRGLTGCKVGSELERSEKFFRAAGKVSAPLTLHAETPNNAAQSRNFRLFNTVINDLFSLNLPHDRLNFTQRQRFF